MVLCCFLCTVRHKVKDLVELVQDDDRLKQERKRSKKNRDKYKGVSSEDYTRNYSMLSFVYGICLYKIKNVMSRMSKCCHGYQDSISSFFQSSVLKCPMKCSAMGRGDAELQCSSDISELNVYAYYRLMFCEHANVNVHTCMYILAYMPLCYSFL